MEESRVFTVTFSMCHCEQTEVELLPEDLEGKTEEEIETLVENLAWKQIRKECTGYDPEDLIEIEENDY